MVLSVLLSCVGCNGLVCVAVLYSSYLMVLFVLLTCVGSDGLICVAVLCMI